MTVNSSKKVLSGTSSSDATQSPAAETAKEIQNLLQLLRKSSIQRQRKSHSSSTDSEREDALRLDKLRRIFARLIAEGDLQFSNSNFAAAPAASGKRDCANVSKDHGDASSKWNEWLTKQHEVFVSHLVDGVLLGRSTALRTFCGVVASTPISITGLGVTQQTKIDADCDGKGDTAKNAMLSERLMMKLLDSLIKSRGCFRDDVEENTNTSKVMDEGEENDRILEEALLNLFDSEFVRPHRDVQYFVLKCLRQISSALYNAFDQKKKQIQKKLSKNCKDSFSAKQLTRAEENVGLVAENMCRILTKFDYIARTRSDLADDAGFLFAPPLLAKDSGDVADFDDGEALETDSENSQDDDGDDESSDEETSYGGTNGRKRSLSSKSDPNLSKRSKTRKLIAWQRPYKHRNALQEAWLSVLRLPNLPPRTQKKVLQHLSTSVLQISPTPLRFAEYFTLSFKSGTNKENPGSLTAILSLHGLFNLMLHHKLEYPQFYTSLYQILHPRVLYTKHRTRFLRLLSKALLGNSMLPAYVVASFCKKLCRLALVGPPSGGLFVLALVSNLLRKHGECACLIHRKGDPENGQIEDVFVEDVDDLAKTRALESSLWELLALGKHYHPAVSALAKSLGTEDDKTPMYDMEDFMEHTYKSLFEQEKKRIDSSSSKGGKKSKVSLTFVEPKGLFTDDDVFSGVFSSS